MSPLPSFEQSLTAMISIGSGTARSFSTVLWMVFRSLSTGTTTDSFGSSIRQPSSRSASWGGRPRVFDVGVEQGEPQVAVGTGRLGTHERSEEHTSELQSRFG